MIGTGRGAVAHRLLILTLLAVALLPLPGERLAFVPAYAFGIGGLDSPLNLAAALRGLFGHLWLHAGSFHLLTNVLALAIFGPPLAAAVGGRRYWLLFIATGVSAALCEGLVTGDRLAPLVGASGGISGIIGAVLVHRRWIWLDIPLPAPVSTPAPGPGRPGGRVLPLPLTILVVLELLANGAMAVLPSTEVGPLVDQVAWGAHLGGFAAGWIMGRAMVRAPVDRSALHLRAGLGFVRGAPWPNALTANALTAIAWAMAVLVTVRG